MTSNTCVRSNSFHPPTRRRAMTQSSYNLLSVIMVFNPVSTKLVPISGTFKVTLGSQAKKVMPGNRKISPLAWLQANNNLVSRRSLVPNEKLFFLLSAVNVLGLCIKPWNCMASVALTFIWGNLEHVSLDCLCLDIISASVLTVDISHYWEMHLIYLSP